MANRVASPPVQPPFRNAPGFRATGRGYFNRLPNFPATEANANGILVNRGLASTDKNFKLPIFVVGVSTAWQVSGSTGQAATSRTFYPHNLSQQPLNISGISANMYEYDRMVEFMIAHHQTAVTGFVSDPNAGAGPDTRAVEFVLKPYIVDTGRVDRRGKRIMRTIYGGLPGSGRVGAGNGAKFQGYFLEVPSGHERFKNVIPWQLSMQISYDFLNPYEYGVRELYRNIQKNYMTTFGQLYGRDKNGHLIAGAWSERGTGFGVSHEDNSADLGVSGSDYGSAQDYWQHLIGGQNG